MKLLYRMASTAIGTLIFQVVWMDHRIRGLVVNWFDGGLQIEIRSNRRPYIDGTGNRLVISLHGTDASRNYCIIREFLGLDIGEECIRRALTKFQQYINWDELGHLDIDPIIVEGGAPGTSAIASPDDWQEPNFLEGTYLELYEKVIDTPHLKIVALVGRDTCIFQVHRISKELLLNLTPSLENLEMGDAYAPYLLYGRCILIPNSQGVFPPDERDMERIFEVGIINDFSEPYPVGEVFNLLNGDLHEISMAPSESVSIPEEMVLDLSSFKTIHSA